MVSYGRALMHGSPGSPPRCAVRGDRKRNKKNNTGGMPITENTIGSETAVTGNATGTRPIQENRKDADTERERGSRHMPEDPAPQTVRQKAGPASQDREVFRKTELNNAPVGAEHDIRKRILRHAVRTRKKPDADESYALFEASLKGFIWSFIDRGDLAEDEMCGRIDVLSQRLDRTEKSLEKQINELEHRVSVLEEKEGI